MDKNVNTLPHSLLIDLEKRQKYVLHKLVVFLKRAAILSFLLFLIIFALQWYTGTLPQNRYGLVALSQPNVAKAIVFFIGLIVIYVHFLFFVLAVTFVPYTIFVCLKAAQTTDSGRRGLRWFQLLLAAFLPIGMFGIIWSGFLPDSIETTSIFFKDPKKIVILLGGIFLVYLFLWQVNKRTPIEWVSPRIAILSSMLWMSLFLSYGSGVGVYSSAMLFGILLYLATNTEKLEEVGRRLITYDYDPSIVSDLEKLAVRKQKVNISRDNINLKREELYTKKEEHSENIKEQKLSTEIEATEQMSKIEQTRMDFNKKTSEVILSTLEKKVDMIQRMQDVVSTELERKVTFRLEEHLEKLKKESLSDSPEVLHQKMSDLIFEMNASLQNVPDGLRQLQSEMVATLEQTAMQIEKQTSLLEHLDSEDNDSENQKSEVENIFNRNVSSGFSSNQENAINMAYAEALEESYIGSNNIFTVQSLVTYFEKNQHLFERLTTILLYENLENQYQQTRVFTKESIKMIKFSTAVKEYASTL